MEIAWGVRGGAWDPRPWNEGPERKPSCKEALTRLWKKQI